MSDITIRDATLKVVQTKPDDGDVILRVQFEAAFTRDALRLIPRTGQQFTVTFAPNQLEFNGVDMLMDQASNKWSDKEG